MNFRNWSDVGNFPGVREFTVVMHLLKNLDNHSDTMQLAILKNLGGTLPNLLTNLPPRQNCYEEHSASGQVMKMAISVWG